MSQYILILILGLGAGAVYAELSMGIVLTFHGAATIIFAAAAMATVPLFMFNELHARRRTLPLPGLGPNVGRLRTSAQVSIALLVAAVVERVSASPIGDT